MSTTAATRGTSARARRARSSMVTSIAGGRLSATNQSRSSSALAAVERPAPDMPVIMTISGEPAWLVMSPLSVSPLSQRNGDLLGQPRAESRHLGDLVGGCPTQPPARAEVLGQRGLPRRPKPGQRIKFAGALRGRPLGPVVGDR